MHAFIKTQIGPFLVMASVLTVWTLLAVEPGMAHQKGGAALLAPSCRTIPDDTTVGPSDAFFGSAQEKAITSTTATHSDLMTKRGVGTSPPGQRRGDQRFHYAKITIPTLAAGELRVFDPTDAGGRSATTPSDAILCRKGSQIASSRKTYTGAHRSAESAASTAQDRAGDARDASTVPDTPTAVDALNARHAANDPPTTPTQDESTAAQATDANTDVNAVRSALSRARSALIAVENALRAAARDAFTQANRNTLTAGADAAETAADELTDELDLNETPNLTTSSTVIPDDKDTAVDAAQSVLAGTNGDDALDLAAGVLLTWAQEEHSGFKIRATVSPGDEEYVVVVALPNTATSPDPHIAAETALTLNVQFQGAIDTTGTADLTGRLQSDTPLQYSIATTAAGLLTLETTGSVDTVGVLEEGATSAVATNDVAQADSGGAGDNFKIDVPLVTDTYPQTYTLSVRGNVPEVDIGTYTLGMDFKVAMTHTTPPDPTADATGVTVAAGAAWGADVQVPDDGLTAADTPEIKTDLHTNNRVDEDYFAFSIANDTATQGFLTVEATEDGTAATDANPKGTLYGPRGEITADATSTGFLMRVPVNVPQNSLMDDYLVKVERGREGAYRLKFIFRAGLLFGPGDFPGVRGKAQQDVNCGTTALDGNEPNAPNDYQICPVQSNDPGQREIERFVFDMQETGTLYLHTTGDTDTVGTLYGPDGTLIDSDNDSGDGKNFRLVARVGVGLHLLEVRGKGRQEEGVYQLVTNFIRGAGPVDTGDTGTGDDDGDGDGDTDTGTGTPGTDLDPIGSLDEPAHGSFRSGIGVLRGWVCNAGGGDVEIRLTNTSTDQITEITAPNGSSRGDVDVDQLCTSDGGRGTRTTRTSQGTNVGFAVQFNYNLLPEGEYEAEAWISSGRGSAEQVGLTDAGQTNRFTVVHISDEEFLEGVESGEVRVEDFPFTGDTTILEWDESSQNFQIVDLE